MVYGRYNELVNWVYKPTYNWNTGILILPPGKRLHFAIENGPVEIIDLPSYKMVMFHSYVNLYQRV